MFAIFLHHSLSSLCSLGSRAAQRLQQNLLLEGGHGSELKEELESVNSNEFFRGGDEMMMPSEGKDGNEGQEDESQVRV